MRRFVSVMSIVIMPYFASCYDTFQIWTRGGGQWDHPSCRSTFVHFRPVQDIRLSERLDVDCYCVLFDPNLTPDDLYEMEVVYRYYSASRSWDLWFNSSYSEWRNSTYSYPRFKVHSNQTVSIATQNDDVTRDLQNKINIQIENGVVYLLCSPNNFIDPATLITTTTTTTTQSTTTSNTTTVESTNSRNKESSKTSKSKNNSTNYIIVGVVAGVIVVILIVIIVIVAMRKAKTVEKQSGNGLIGHIMRQKSTIGQAHSVYSNHTWTDDAPVGDLGTVVYDYDGILAPDNNTNKAAHARVESNKSVGINGGTDHTHCDTVSVTDSAQDGSSANILVYHM